MDIKLMLE